MTEHSGLPSLQCLLPSGRSMALDAPPTQIIMWNIRCNKRFHAVDSFTCLFVGDAITELVDGVVVMTLDPFEGGIPVLDGIEHFHPQILILDALLAFGTPAFLLPYIKPLVESIDKVFRVGINSNVGILDL